jgi:hypothetical protein
MPMLLSPGFWRVLTLLVRFDIAAGIALTVGLLLWLNWH